MPKPLTIALIYDFDGTLSPNNMQEYEFIPSVGREAGEFWRESTDLAREQDADSILAYMWYMIKEAKNSNQSVKRESFRRFGENVALFNGVHGWFGRINAYAAAKGIAIEHYINSSGIKEMIEGTAIAGEFKHIYACSFLYDVDGIAYWPAVSVNYTNKTQFLFKINKGIEGVFESKMINKFVPDDQRPVPFANMIYFGDGTTDVPCMRLVREKGGHSIAVYDPAQEAVRRDSMEQLVQDRRVSYVCPADYSEGGKIDSLVKAIVDKMESDHKLRKLSEECGLK